jgi:hypothetical protein
MDARCAVTRFAAALSIAERSGSGSESSASRQRSRGTSREETFALSNSRASEISAGSPSRRTRSMIASVVTLTASSGATERSSNTRRSAPASSAMGPVKRRRSSLMA